MSIFDERSEASSLDCYYLDCEVRGLRKVTIDGYRHQLAFFSRKYEMTQEGVDRFIVDMRREGRHTATINSYLIAIRAYVKWAGLDIKIRTLKKEEVIKEVYSDEDIRRLILKPKGKNFIEWRTWALICFLVGTGARISTALEIKDKDIDWKNSMVVFRHMKNHNQQYFPLSKTLKLALCEYIDKKGDTLYLFCNSYGEKADLRTVQEQIAKYNNGRGVKITSAHAFRRTFITNYIKQGGDAYRLQHLIGWKSIEMVDTYARLYANDYAKDIDELCLLDNCSKKKIKL